eukprot:TRINITY_DN103362_c0_g1_i1.p3 TRINITY_DN103362_c0_g1~~TRINITY_DN103362_c0_g1_i1.p3  ORF type:complete len:271 (+),score=114.14 TRINITY_DN103362_c0_g1_i1:124-936(+)
MRLAASAGAAAASAAASQATASTKQVQAARVQVLAAESEIERDGGLCTEGAEPEFFANKVAHATLQAARNQGRAPSDVSSYSSESALSLGEGPYSSVLHYMAFDSMHGVLVSSPDTIVVNDASGGREEESEAATTTVSANRKDGALIDAVRAQFLLASLRMQSVFEMSHRVLSTTPPEPCDDAAQQNDKKKATIQAAPFAAHPGMRAIGQVHEQRVRIRTVQTSEFDKLQYWVAGRSYGPTTQCYVCYHEAVPQRVVDIAFRLALSLHHQ